MASFIFSGRGGDMNAVDRFRIRRDRRINARKRLDDEEEANNGGGKKGGGHGNTKLPYGLCLREGIEIGKDWSPRDAWGALADKGITPAGEFAKRKGGGNTFKTGLATYKNTHIEKYGDSYIIRGDMVPDGEGGKGYENAKIAAYTNKKELFARLREHGIKKIKDPDTGEVVNPMKMDLPRVVAKDGDHMYTDLVLGIRASKTGRPYDRKGYTLAAKGFDGKKKIVGTFDSPKQAMDYATGKLKCAKEDLRETKDYKEMVKPRVLESEKDRYAYF